jgi:hypothetical protein
MEKLQEFQAAARIDGFVEVEESDDPNIAWFRNDLPDPETKVHKRLCIDSLTGCATVYWETTGAKLNSKTFRTVSSMRTWLSLNSVR